MSSLWILAFGIAFCEAVIASDSLYINQGTNCPDAKNIAPCTCDREAISCMWARSGRDIKFAMIARPKNSRNFRTFYLTQTNVKEILPRTFEHYSFSIVNMHSNKLRYIGDDAFAGSEDVMIGLTLQYNELDHVPYEAIRDLRKLQNLVLAFNRITTIPEHLFRNLVSLQGLFLNDNQISYVGPGAFSTLVDLRILYLSNNRITTLGEYFFRNPSVNFMVGVLLANNQISSISPRAFEGTENLGTLDLTGNQLEALNKTTFFPLETKLNDVMSLVSVQLQANPIQCDSRIGWMLNLTTVAKRRFMGMACNGKSLADMTEDDLS